MAVFSLKQRHQKNCAVKVGRGGLISQIFLQEYSPIIFQCERIAVPEIYIYFTSIKEAEGEEVGEEEEGEEREDRAPVP